MKCLLAQRLGNQRRMRRGHVADAEIGDTGPDLLLQDSLHVLAKLELNAGIAFAISSDHRRQDAVGDRHQARDDDLTAMAAAEFAHVADADVEVAERSEEHTSELQSLMRISYAVFCLKKKKQHTKQARHTELKTTKCARL